MRLDPDWAITLLLLSVALAVGWAWLKIKRPALMGNQKWGQIARFFYIVGLPYVALISGLLSPHLLGLTGIEHFGLVDLSADLPQTLAQIQYATLLMLLEWLLNSHPALITGLTALLILFSIRIGLIRADINLTTECQISISDTFYDSLHWGFYRGLYWLLTGDLYLGVIWGIAWVVLEETLTVFLQQEWPRHRTRLLIRLMLLILTSTIFFYSPNLWLVWGLHLAMVGVLRVERLSVKS